MANVYRNGVKVTPDNIDKLLEEARAQLKRTPATVVVVPDPIDAIGAVLVYPPTRRRK